MSEFQFLPAWPVQPDALFYVTLAFAAATLLGEAVFRWLRIPRIAGYALTGLLCGWLNKHFDVQWSPILPTGSLQIVVDVALGLLLFELGCRVNLRWIRANPWILLTSLLESGLTAAAVAALLWKLGYAWPIVWAVSAIAMCTSPAVVMRVIVETGARGQVTERLLFHAALNSIYALLAGKVVLAWMQQEYQMDVFSAVLHPVYLLCGSFLLALVLALAIRALNRRFDLRTEQGVLLLFALLLLMTVLVTLAKLSVLMVPLLAGVLLRHLSERPLLWPPHFGTAGGVLVVLLFVLTGMSLRLETFVAGGVIGLALIGVRLLAKVVAIVLLSRPSGLSWRQGVALGLALAPMSGIALSMTFDFRAIFPELDGHISAVVLSAIAVLELCGPVLTQLALRWVAEIPALTATHLVQPAQHIQQQKG